MFDKRRKLNVIPELKDEIFLTNQVDMRFYPDMFKIEFKQVNQQVDRINEEKHLSLIINRRTIGLTPMMMKQLAGIINNVLVNYEKQHGEIKMPKAVKKRKTSATTKKSKNSAYIG